MAKKDEGREVPRGVLLVAILALALLIAIVTATLHAAVTGNRDVIDSFSLLSSQDIWVMGIAAGIFAVIFFTMFLGLLFLRGWGRVMVIIFGLLAIVVFSLKSIILFSSTEQQILDEVEVSSSDVIVLASSFGLIAVALMSVWYLSRLKVILAFEAQEVVLTKRKIAVIERKIDRGRQRCNAGEMSKAELAKLKAEYMAKEKVLRGRIRHLDKVRLAREKKQKEAEDRVVKRWEEKQARKEEKKTERVERKAEKELEKEEKVEKGEAEKQDDGKKGNDEGEVTKKTKN